MTLKNQKIELLVGVCVTEKDWISYKNSILHSLSCIEKHWKNDCIFYIVIQNKNFLSKAETNLDKNKKILYTPIENVSTARNACIKKAKELKVKFILFHDASISWTNSAAYFLHKNREKNITLKANVSFSSFHDDSQFHFTATKCKINPIYEPYVWSYLFSLDKIKDLYFNENFGPGQYTRFKSGEDVLFLFDYFNNNSFHVLTNKNAKIHHPPRDSQYSKHLTYALGQGKMFRILLSNNKTPSIYRDIFLFFGNSFFRCLLLRPNSFKILRHRFQGFFNEDL
ncbi:hypothetical protein [Providencia rettgeri]|uniref:hypothetical protein n=1 Tax=Providencia rettgeri TaxID=587 RepID=UPI0023AA713B|nr:hypothetical protein [Providencia rettgeri]